MCLLLQLIRTILHLCTIQLNNCNKIVVGVVDECHSGVATVSFMKKVRGNKFTWPRQRDQQLVTVEQVLCTLSRPTQTDSKNFVIENVTDIDQLLQK